MVAPGLLSMFSFSFVPDSFSFFSTPIDSHFAWHLCIVQCIVGGMLTQKNVSHKQVLSLPVIQISARALTLARSNFQKGCTTLYTADCSASWNCSPRFRDVLIIGLPFICNMLRTWKKSPFFNSKSTMSPYRSVSWDITSGSLNSTERSHRTLKNFLFLAHKVWKIRKIP